MIVSGSQPGTIPPDVLQALQDRYRVTMATTIEVLRGYAAQLAVTPTAPATLDALRRETHRIHGTAGSYGHETASRLAAAAEVRAVQWAADPTLDRAERAGIVSRFVADLSAAVTHNGPADMPPTR